MILRATEGQEADGSPLMSEFGMTEELLSRIVDAVQVQTLVAMRAAGAKKTPKFTPTPRPSTAYERIAHKKRLAGHQRIVGMVKVEPGPSPAT